MTMVTDSGKGTDLRDNQGLCQLEHFRAWKEEMCARNTTHSRNIGTSSKIQNLAGIRGFLRVALIQYLESGEIGT